MAAVYSFTADNLGSPDMYTVTRDCRRIRIVEKDRTASSLATFNVYAPAGGTTAISYLGGETCELVATGGFSPGSNPFAIETVNVGSAIFSVIEE